MLTGQTVVVTGGTGSFGKLLVRRLLSGEIGDPAKVIVFSRDEGKQHAMRVSYMHRAAATDEVIYRNFQQKLDFRIGDVRDLSSLLEVLRDADVVFNAAALKQVPTCEYFPFEAVQTNVTGAENIVRAIREHDLSVHTVVGISTDKACKPVNVMGMTKAIQERILIRANMDCPKTRFFCVRYGNILASRGSVIPLFHDQIRSGGPVTITTPAMTRFLLSLEQAVDMTFSALAGAKRGETYVPRCRSSKVTDIAAALIGERKIETRITGIRPGEKIHEILVSEEEVHRTVSRDGHFVILPILPEIREPETGEKRLESEFSSADHVISRAQTEEILRTYKLMVEDDLPSEDELVR